MVWFLAGCQAHRSSFQAMKSMAEQSTPRGIIKQLLRGEPPPRPLLMPIIFSLGSKLESVGLRKFQSNPTKIANAMRQIRGTWKVDGLACYFDSFLEAEALGCKREWHSDESCELACPSFLGADDLRETCGALDAISRKGQIPVACDVLQRLKVMLKDEPALMVRVTGPLTLASRLSGEQMQARNTASLLAQDLVEFASEVTAAVSKSFLEAGADVVFLRESFFPEMATELYGRWASLLAPIVNVIRFYEALPVLLLGDSALARVELASVVNRTWEGIWCPVLSCDVSHWGMWRSHGATPCLGLPSAVFGQSHDLENSITSIKELVASQKPLLLTSRGDISATVDMKTFATVLGSVREALLVGGSNRV